MHTRSKRRSLKVREKSKLLGNRMADDINMDIWKQVGNATNAAIWFRTRSNEGSCELGNEPLNSIQCG
jgi:hypothetical protein